LPERTGRKRAHQDAQISEAKHMRKKDKREYVYLLTPMGIAEKLR